MSEHPLVICLLGPTAAGKTDSAIRLSQELPCDIVSVDSAMVYRGMEIGTAKPDAATLAAAPHRLIDIRDPWETYNAGDFCSDVALEIADISSQGRVPVLAGGTMMYFRALQSGLAPLPEADPQLRDSLNARAAERGWPALHAELAALDPLAASRIKPADGQRIQRALEVIALSGEKLSDLQQATAPAIAATFVNIGLMPADRSRLHQNIRARFMAMLDAGLLAEVAGLLELEGVSASSPSMRAVGYRQIVAHLLGESSLTDATESAIVATRQLAKRQMTWMRGMGQMQLVDSDSEDKVKEVLALVHQHLASRGD